MSSFTNFVDDRSNLGVVNDPRLKIKPGKILQEYLSKKSSSPIENLDINDVQELYEGIKKSRPEVYLHELLVGSELIIPKLEIPERNPELEARVNKLKHMLAEKEYRKMTKNVNFTSRFKSEDSIGYQIKQINSGLIGVFQFIVTIAAAFMFGFMGVEVFLGLTLDLGVKLLLGIIFALIVGMAELYFLAINLANDVTDTPTGLTVSKLKIS